jgi:hypothetical protein
MQMVTQKVADCYAKLLVFYCWALYLDLLNWLGCMEKVLAMFKRICTSEHKGLAAG